ncbi:Hsp70 family protein [Streptomyces sp. NPDC101151]|uniref:Hsp70 family protein n=1 Tax=Streptomyces sp. NPDC101151 TaxID=3366115 RepID=UPI0038191522
MIAIDLGHRFGRVGRIGPDGQPDVTETEFDAADGVLDPARALHALAGLVPGGTAAGGAEADRAVVLGLPASGGREDEVRRAADGLGLRVERVVPDPVAVALHYRAVAEGVDRTVLVCDQGATTLDLTVLAITPDLTVRVVRTRSHRLGGDDWDAALAARLARGLPDGVDPRRTAELLRRGLGDEDSVTADVSDPAGGQHRLTLDRADFEAAVAPLRAQTLAAVTAELTAGDPAVDAVLLAGGLCAMPGRRAEIEELPAAQGLTVRCERPAPAVVQGLLRLQEFDVLRIVTGPAARSSPTYDGYVFPEPAALSDPDPRGWPPVPEDPDPLGNRGDAAAGTAAGAGVRTGTGATYGSGPGSDPVSGADSLPGSSTRPGLGSLSGADTGATPGTDSSPGTGPLSGVGGTPGSVAGPGSGSPRGGGAVPGPGSRPESGPTRGSGPSPTAVPGPRRPAEPSQPSQQYQPSRSPQPPSAEPPSPPSPPTPPEPATSAPGLSAPGAARPAPSTRGVTTSDSPDAAPDPHTLLAVPVGELQAVRRGDHLLVLWAWPDGSLSARVRWRREGSTAGGGPREGDMICRRRVYEHDGGLDLAVGREAVTLTVEALVAASGVDCEGRSALLVPPQPPVVEYEPSVRRRVKGRMATVTFTSETGCELPGLRIVHGLGRFRPTSTAEGTVLHEVPAQRLPARTPLTVEFPLPATRGPSWLVCFPADGDAVADSGIDIRPTALHRLRVT